MSDKFNEKHLLWWVLKAIHGCRADGTTPQTLLSETLWKNLGAPDWVLPAVKEKYAEMPLLAPLVEQ
jgi:hypothetical protein